jgi:signal transduction histidine kinase
MSSEKRRQIALYLAAWTALSLLFAANAVLVYSFTLKYLRPTSSPQPYGPYEWMRTALPVLADWYLWAIFAPLVFRLARAIPIDRDTWPRAVPIHLLLSVLVAAIKVATRFALAHTIPWIPTFAALPGNLGSLPINIAVYWGMVGMTYAFVYHARYRDRELRAAQLESRLTQAQLHTLQTQLQPHFLFNTLHSVSVLIREGENDAADRMLARLSELLRLSLDSISRQEQPLARELEFVAGYVAIQQIRFQDRLTVNSSIDERATNALVPTLVLQPLVENAIRHAIAPRTTGGRLDIIAEVIGAELRLVVADDGPGIPADADPSTFGVGLGNTRARLEQLYGAAHRFTIANDPAGGLRAEIVIPLTMSS